MNVTIQVPAAAHIVLATTYNVCDRNFAKTKSQIENNGIRMNSLTAIIHIKGILSWICFFVVTPITDSICSLTINCDYDTFKRKSTEPDLFRLTDKIIGLLFDELKQQGYIK
ncbi:MAG: hypothetical protein RSF82_12090 [Angelakisella sp.]